jgi:hypothetical protein
MSFRHAIRLAYIRYLSIPENHTNRYMQGSCGMCMNKSANTIWWAAARFSAHTRLEVINGGACVVKHVVHAAQVG